MPLQTKFGRLTCDSDTIAAVRQKFQNQLKRINTYDVPVRNWQSLDSSYFKCFILLHPTDAPFNNKTAWQHLGCLPEITVLGIHTVPNFTTNLPDEWGMEGSFQNLQMLVLDSWSLSGSLPEAWGSSGSSLH